MATGTVRQIIEFKGQDSATAVADKVKKSVKDLDAASQKASKATAEIDGRGIKEIQEVSGDVESALKGIGDFAGDAKEQVSQLGDSFGAVESVMRLLPGPIGLATSAVAGMAIGAKLLADYVGQSAAKMQLLAGPGAERLRTQFDLSVDGAVKLSQAIAELNNDALAPSDGLLRSVIANAESLGADGADAAARFVTAWQGGPDALKAFQAEFGKLQGAAKDASAVARGLGVSPEGLGLTKASTAAEQERLAVTESITRAAQLQIELGRARAELERQTALQEASFTVVKTLEAGRQKIALEGQVDSINKAIAAERENLSAIEASTNARQRQADAAGLLASRVELLNAQAATAATVEQRRSLQSEALTARQLAATRALNQFDQLHGATLNEKLITERNLLQAKVLQEDAARKAAADAIAAEKRAAAAAGAARARAARDARQRATERFAAEEVTDLAGQEATRRELSNAAIRENIKALAEQAQAQQRLTDARIAGEEDPAARARLEIADIEVRKLRELDAVREDVTINEATRRARLTAIQVEATNKIVAIQTAADARVAATAEQSAQKQRDAASAALSTVGAAAQAAEAYAGPGGLAGAMGQAVTSAQTLISQWSSTKSNAGNVIGAVGNVAAAVVDGERQKAGVLAAMEAAQSVASFATGDLVGGSGHAAAAVMYGAVAGGLIGGSTGGGGAAPGGFGAQAQPAPVAGGQGMGGGMTVVNNYNAPLGTRYEIGKSVAESAKAAKAWAKVPAGV